MEILQYIFHIALWILVVGGALIVIILVFILCKFYLILSKINHILGDINYKYNLVVKWLSKPFSIFKK